MLIVQSELEQRLGRSLTTEESTAFTLINSAMQSLVEKMIGSSLETASETTRYFDGGVQHLKINPCTNISAVTLVDVDYTVIDTIDTDYYITEPVNSTLKTMIRYRYGKLYSGMQNIGVTAKFSIAGDTDSVNIVKDAMLDELESIIDNSEGILEENIEGYSVKYANYNIKPTSPLTKIKYLFPEII